MMSFTLKIGYDHRWIGGKLGGDWGALTLSKNLCITGMDRCKFCYEITSSTRENNSFVC
ncbi:hypothetical protein LguiB_012032 [Lonicera macranthoides]